MDRLYEHLFWVCLTHDVRECILNLGNFLSHRTISASHTNLESSHSLITNIHRSRQILSAPLNGPIEGSNRNRGVRVTC
jgi:hypothetical protein